MKHYLTRTLLYGAGVGILLFLLISSFFIVLAINALLICGGLIFILLLIILFLATEIFPSENSITPDAKARRQDKIALFVPIALSGVGLALVILLFKADWNASPSAENISEGFVLAMFCACPFFFIYVLSILRVLIRLFRRRSEIFKQETGPTTNGV